MIELTREYMVDCILVLQSAKESIHRRNDVFVCNAIETGVAKWSPNKMSKSDFVYWGGLRDYLYCWIRDMLGDHFTLEAWSQANNLPTTPEPLKIAREWWLNWMIEELREEILSFGTTATGRSPKMSKIIWNEVHDEGGNLTKIVINNRDGGHEKNSERRSSVADITMCAGFNCPKKENCYRFTATPNPHYQSYFSDAPWTGTTCPEFWDNSDRKESKDVQDNLE